MMSFSEQYSTMLQAACRLGDLQLGVVGRDGVAVLGTQDYWNKVGSVRPKGCHLTRHRDSEIINIIRDPGFEAGCNYCENSRNCNYSIILCAPIFKGSVHAGSVGLLGQGEDIRKRILEKEDSWVEYIGELSSVFSDYSPLIGVLRLRSISDASLNSLFQINGNRGLIITDNDQGILRLNTTAKEFLRLPGSNDLAQSLHKIIPKRSLNDLLTENIRNNSVVVKLDDRLFRLSRLDDSKVYPYNGVALAIDELSTISLGSVTKSSKAIHRMVSVSAKMNEVKTLIHSVAKLSLPVLIQGESGTGKELVARSIHELSARNQKKLVAFNCSAIPEALFESELFGYEKGAFTGAASSGKKGYIELADGGTLFLDEVGDLNITNQAKLLRVLEEKEFYRIGGQQLIRSDIRIVAATNAPLAKLVAEKKFREDLYFRLNAVCINLPPLRERKEDILLLCRHFLNQLDDRNEWTITPQAQELLLNYPWPGNIRELRNTMEYLSAFSKNSQVTFECLPDYIRNVCLSGRTDYHQAFSAKPDLEACRMALDLFGRSTAGKRQAAAYLKVSLATFYRLLKKFDLR